jgi:hypothetical protein
LDYAPETVRWSGRMQRSRFSSRRCGKYAEETMPKSENPAMLALAEYKKTLKGKRPNDTVAIFLAGFKRGVEWAMQPPENDKEPPPAPEKKDDEIVDAEVVEEK